MSSDLQARTNCPGCRRSFSYSRRHPPHCCPYCNEPLDHDDYHEANDGPDHQILIPGTQKDDGQPYGVLGKKPPPLCPKCNASTIENDPICPNCNFNQQTGRHVPKVYPEFDQTWESGISLRYRLIALAGCQVVNLLLFWFINQQIEDVPVTIGGWLIVAVAQAFLLGTYDRVRIQRSTRGKVTITKVWRACFFPLPANSITWRGLEEVGVRRDDSGLIEWVIFIFLLGDGILPGILWWYFAIRTGRFCAALMKDQGAIAHCLYAGTDADKAEAIATAVHELTGLPYKAVG